MDCVPQPARGLPPDAQRLRSSVRRPVCPNDEQRPGFDWAQACVGFSFALTETMTNTTLDLAGGSGPGLARLLGACLLAMACAGSPRAQPETAARVKDSVPEKIAAQRATSGGLHLEEEDERWGIEMARARRAPAEPRTQAAAPATAPPVKVLDVPPSPLHKARLPPSDQN